MYTNNIYNNIYKFWEIHVPGLLQTGLVLMPLVHRDVSGRWKANPLFSDGSCRRTLADGGLHFPGAPRCAPESHLRCPSSCLHWVCSLRISSWMKQRARQRPHWLWPSSSSMYETSDRSKSWSQLYFSFIKPRLGKVWVILFQLHISTSWITDPAHKPAPWHKEPLWCQQRP